MFLLCIVTQIVNTGFQCRQDFSVAFTGLQLYVLEADYGLFTDLLGQIKPEMRHVMALGLQLTATANQKNVNGFQPCPVLLSGEQENLIDTGLSVDLPTTILQSTKVPTQYCLIQNLWSK